MNNLFTTMSPKMSYSFVQCVFLHSVDILPLSELPTTNSNQVNFHRVNETTAEIRGVSGLFYIKRDLFLSERRANEGDDFSLVAAETLRR